ncbi:MAG TPA: dual specificity protein phosphatase [Chroococcidiopsis sp.]
MQVNSDTWRPGYIVRSLYRLFSSPSARSSGASRHSSRGLSPVNWVLPGTLALGRLPREGESAPLLDAQIKVIVSLCAPSEGTLPADVQQNFYCVRHILPDSDFYIPLRVDQLATVVHLIHLHIQNEKPVYVHCLAGMERSPTVCIAYLCRYHRVDLWEAINSVRQVRPTALPTNAQLRVIREFIDGESAS